MAAPVDTKSSVPLARLEFSCRARAKQFLAGPDSPWNQDGKSAVERPC